MEDGLFIKVKQREQTIVIKKEAVLTAFKQWLDQRKFKLLDLWPSYLS